MVPGDSSPGTIVVGTGTAPDVQPRSRRLSREGRLKAMANRSNITLVHLRYVVTAADCKSMTEAAGRLHVAQSAISNAVAAIERRLTIQLFIRHRWRALELTADGARIVEAARRVLDAYEDFLDDVAATSGDVSGTVRLGCMATATPFVIPKLLAATHDRLPDLSVELHELSPSQAMRDLRDGHCELALLYDFGLPDDIDKVHLQTLEPYVLLPPGHPSATERAVHLRDLNDLPMILLDLPHSAEYFLSVARQGGIRPTVTHRSTSYEAVRTLVANGHGFSILNQQPKSPTTYDGQALIHRRIADVEAGLDLVIATYHDIRPNPRMAALKALIIDLFAQTSEPAGEGVLKGPA